MTTTALDPIMAAAESVVLALSRPTLGGAAFTRYTREHDIEAWAANEGSPILRSFQIDIDPDDPADDEDPELVTRERQMTVTVAYPTLPGLAAAGTRDGLLDAIDDDGGAIETALYHSDNYPDGVHGQLPAGYRTREEGDVLFLSCDLLVQYDGPKSYEFTPNR